ncbi:hypothetical protein PV328_008764 [Microctonus aethiopoides]|uniref:Uncharacterized protein n=1 Tax=Microctonus aethiopoides TaxID=144406 RepID=A0AA39FK93_9HYME|nr:hypothetical protein PV328_008764 [Microctonus aethiopoides]
MSREFYVPCTPYAYPQCGSSSTAGVVSNNEAGGMDCMPLRPGPFHYLISEQAKSLVALQELQNEVGALLEFRDLVIETFPNLRHKMAASTTASVACSVMSSPTSNSHIPLPLSSSPSSRRISEWEPGKVRRRVAPRDAETLASSLPRSRSNSHSGGSKNSATVQDSGFSTETSSKDSASTAIARPTSPKPTLDEAEDELWNLLDVIHRKGVRLREEVESLQDRLESVAPDDLGLAQDVLEAVRKVTGNNNESSSCNRDDDKVEEEEEKRQVAILQREKEQLLDKVAELEAETISSRVRAQELQSELAALSAIRHGLEDRLRVGLDIDTELHIPTAQRKPPPLTSISPCQSPKNGVSIRSKSSAFASVANKSHKNRFRTRTIEKNVIANVVAVQSNNEIDPAVAAQERRVRLGALDSVLISPMRVAHVKNVDTQKIAAILCEHSELELQRHLITTTVHNQCLQERLDEVQKSTEKLSERLDKAREENDDLRFRLEERNIELEGTRARVRVLERLQQRPPTEAEPEVELDIETRCEPCYLEPGSSTESARDHHNPIEVKPSPRRRPPSRIPLPDSIKTPTASKSPYCNGKSDSRESLKTSLKSMTKSTRDSSRDSHTSVNNSKLSLSKTRDSSRESLNKSLPKNGKETNRESLSTKSSLPRNNSSRDSLNKSSLSRARDSLESGNNHHNHLHSNGCGPGNTPRRPLAPARRSHSYGRESLNIDMTSKALTDPPTSWCSSHSGLRHSESSLYPDSLNEDSKSLTGSTRIEFIIGSPTRRFRPNSAWQNRYFDSIDSTAIAAESLMTDEYPLRCGEALAECDSLDTHPISSES